MGQRILVIENTWDGRLLPRKAQVKCTLQPTPDHLRLQIDSPYYHDPEPEGPIGSTDGLWNYEVVEFFVLGHPREHEQIQYLEVELSPHGHHLVLRFAGVRNLVGIEAVVDYQATIEEDRWQGVAHIPWDWIPQGPHRCNLYAIHGVGKRRHYLAMKSLSGKEPDFHRLEFFTPIVLRRPTTGDESSPK